jgi:hopene-associated glycosyltransferase HpnB
VTILSLLATMMWVLLLAAPWRPWATRERLEPSSAYCDEDLSDVTAVIPARNEAQLIGRSLRALREQGRGLHIVVVDDQSTDGTAQAARQGAGPDLEILGGTALPDGWSGKLWALEQGRRRVTTPLTLLLDADIELQPGMLRAAKGKLVADGIDFLSLLAAPRMLGTWEKLLMPAFVYFFKLLYPFSLCQAKESGVAAAAGGFVLLKTSLLNDIGGLSAIKDELIDDCALARRVKRCGGRIWLGLSRGVRSLRPNPGLRSIWDMVARTAFTQLDYSILWLTVCTVAMLLAFCIPVVALAHPAPAVQWMGMAALMLMILSYVPTLRYYGRSSGWALAMPLIGAMYLTMTWSSALAYWRGRRANWKGRVYYRDAGNA